MVLEDYKSEMTLFDASTEDEGQDIHVNVFRPEQEMPHVDARDVVVIFKTKYQMWKGVPSLITNRLTDIHVYDAQKIPNCKISVRGALKEPVRKVRREPSANEQEYVAALYNKIDKTSVPDREEFQIRSRQSLNVKEKFSLLQDVRDSTFSDLVVEVVRDPFDSGDQMTLWVSDYTENSAFFNHILDFADGTESWTAREGDPYGYTDKFSADTSAASTQQRWTGPLGKKSMQISCWDPHADFIRGEVKRGQWVRLRNVRIRYGRNNSNIEGFLHGDQQAPHKINVDLLDPQNGPENTDARLVDALRRKRSYEKEKKKQLQELAGAKRKREDSDIQEEHKEPEKKESAKERRNKKRKRAALLKQVDQKEQEKEAQLGLNELVKCENVDKELTALSSIIEPVYYFTTVKGEAVSIELPFNCAKYRTYARVVDFHPVKLEDFAVSRKINDYDCLSDASGPSDSESEDDPGTLNRFTGKRVWEWCFSLKLEEVSPATKGGKKKPATTWVVVDNLEAQCLTGLDATELRRDQLNLDLLRETMFKLWGDLEERKTTLAAKKTAVSKSTAKIGLRPPVDSSDGEDTSGAKPRELGLSQTSNTPFSCCIRQYGIKEKARGDEHANAGEGVRWKRVFSLFGTKISQA